MLILYDLVIGPCVAGIEMDILVEFILLDGVREGSLAGALYFMNFVHVFQIAVLLQLLVENIAVNVHGALHFG